MGTPENKIILTPDDVEKYTQFEDFRKYHGELGTVVIDAHKVLIEEGNTPSSITPGMLQTQVNKLDSSQQGVLPVAEEFLEKFESVNPISSMTLDTNELESDVDKLYKNYIEPHLTPVKTHKESRESRPVDPSAAGFEPKNLQQAQNDYLKAVNDLIEDRANERIAEYSRQKTKDNKLKYTKDQLDTLNRQTKMILQKYYLANTLYITNEPDGIRQDIKKLLPDEIPQVSPKEIDDAIEQKIKVGGIDPIKLTQLQNDLDFIKKADETGIIPIPTRELTLFKFSSTDFPAQRIVGIKEEVEKDEQELVKKKQQEGHTPSAAQKSARLQKKEETKESLLVDTAESAVDFGMKIFGFKEAYGDIDNQSISQAVRKIGDANIQAKALNSLENAQKEHRKSQAVRKEISEDLSSIIYTLSESNKHPKEIEQVVKEIRERTISESDKRFIEAINRRNINNLDDLLRETHALVSATKNSKKQEFLLETTVMSPELWEKGMADVSPTQIVEIAKKQGFDEKYGNFLKQNFDVASMQSSLDEEFSQIEEGFFISDDSRQPIAKTIFRLGTEYEKMDKTESVADIPLTPIDNLKFYYELHEYVKQEIDKEWEPELREFTNPTSVASTYSKSSLALSLKTTENILYSTPFEEREKRSELNRQIKSLRKMLDAQTQLDDYHQEKPWFGLLYQVEPGVLSYTKEGGPFRGFGNITVYEGVRDIIDQYQARALEEIQQEQQAGEQRPVEQKPRYHQSIDYGKEYKATDAFVKQVALDTMREEYLDIYGKPKAFSSGDETKVITTYLQEGLTFDEMKDLSKANAQKSLEAYQINRIIQDDMSHPFARALIDIDSASELLASETISGMKKKEVPEFFRQMLPGEDDDTIENLIISDQIDDLLMRRLNIEANFVVDSFISQPLTENFAFYLEKLTAKAVTDSSSMEAKVQYTPITFAFETLTALAEEAVVVLPVETPSFGMSMATYFGGGRADLNEYWEIRKQQLEKMGTVKTPDGQFKHPLSVYFEQEWVRDGLVEHIDKRKKEEETGDAKITFGDLEKYTIEYFSSLVEPQAFDAMVQQGYFDDILQVYGKALAVILTGRMDQVPFTIATPMEMDFYLQEQMPDIYSGVIPPSYNSWSGRFSVFLDSMTNEPLGFQESYSYLGDGLGFSYGSVHQTFLNTGTALSVFVPFEKIAASPVKATLKTGSVMASSTRQALVAMNKTPIEAGLGTQAVRGLKAGALEAAEIVEVIPFVDDRGTRIVRGFLQEQMSYEKETPNATFSDRFLRDEELWSEAIEASAITEPDLNKSFRAELVNVAGQSAIGGLIAGTPGALFYGFKQGIPSASKLIVDGVFKIAGLTTEKNLLALSYYYRRKGDLASVVHQQQMSQMIKDVRAGHLDSLFELVNNTSKNGQYYEADYFRQAASSLGIDPNALVLSLMDLGFENAKKQKREIEYLMDGRKILKDKYSRKLKKIKNEELYKTIFGRDEIIYRSNEYKNLERQHKILVRRNTLTETQAAYNLAIYRYLALTKDDPKKFLKQLQVVDLNETDSLKNLEDYVRNFDTEELEFLKKEKGQQAVEFLKSDTTYEQDAYNKSIGLYSFLSQKKQDLNPGDAREYVKSFQDMSLVEQEAKEKPSVVKGTEAQKHNPPSKEMEKFASAIVTIGNNRVQVFFEISKKDKKLSIKEIHIDNPPMIPLDDVMLRVKATKKLFSKKLLENNLTLEWNPELVFFQLKEAPQEMLNSYTELMHQYMDNFVDNIDESKKTQRRQQPKRTVALQVVTSLRKNKNIAKNKDLGTFKVVDTNEELSLHPQYQKMINVDYEIASRAIQEQLNSIQKANKKIKDIEKKNVSILQDKLSLIEFNAEAKETPKKSVTENALAELATYMYNSKIYYDIEDKIKAFAKKIDEQDTPEKKQQKFDEIREALRSGVGNQYRKAMTTEIVRKNRAEQKIRKAEKAIDIVKPTFDEVVEEKVQKPLVTEDLSDGGLETILSTEPREPTPTKIFRGLTSSEFIAVKGTASALFRKGQVGNKSVILMENIETQQPTNSINISEIYFQLEQVDLLIGTEERKKLRKELMNDLEQARKDLTTAVPPDLREYYSDARQIIREMLTKDKPDSDYIGYQTDNLALGSALVGEFKKAGIEVVQHKIKDPYGVPYTIIELTDNVRNKLQRDSLPIIESSEDVRFVGVELRSLYDFLKAAPVFELGELKENDKSIFIDDTTVLNKKYLNNMRKWMGLPNETDVKKLIDAIEQQGMSLHTIREDLYAGYSLSELKDIVKEESLNDKQQQKLKDYIDSIEDFDEQFEFVNKDGQFKSFRLFDGDETLFITDDSGLTTQEARNIVYMAAQEGKSSVKFINASRGARELKTGINWGNEVKIDDTSNTVEVEITEEMRYSVSPRRQPLFQKSKTKKLEQSLVERLTPEAYDQLNVNQKRLALNNMMNHSGEDLYMAESVVIQPSRSGKTFQLDVDGKRIKKNFKTKEDAEQYVKDKYLANPDEDLVVGVAPITTDPETTIKALHNEILEHIVIHTEDGKIRRAVASKKSNAFDSKAIEVTASDSVFDNATVIVNRDAPLSLTLNDINFLLASKVKEFVIVTPTRTFTYSLSNKFDVTSSQIKNLRILNNRLGEEGQKRYKPSVSIDIFTEIASQIDTKNKSAVEVLNVALHACQDYKNKQLQSIFPELKIDIKELEFTEVGTYGYKKDGTGSFQFDGKLRRKELKLIDASRPTADPKRREAQKRNRAIGPATTHIFSTRERIKDNYIAKQVASRVAQISLYKDLEYVSQRDFEIFVGLDDITYGSMPEWMEDLNKVLLERLDIFLNGQIKPSEVLSAYFITVASQQAGEIEYSLFKRRMEKRGMMNAVSPLISQKMDPTKGRFNLDFFIVGKDGKINVRAEEMMAAWLITPKGRKAMRAFDEAIANGMLPEFDFYTEFVDLLNIRRFGWSGTKNNFPLGESFDSLKFKLAEMTETMNQQGKAYNEGLKQKRAFAATPKITQDALEANLKRLRGVGPVKAPFLAQLLGFGAGTTIDSKEIQALLGLDPMDPKDIDKKAKEINKKALSNLKKWELQYLKQGVKRYGKGRFSEMRTLIGHLRDAVEYRYKGMNKELQKRGINIRPEHYQAIMHQWIWAKMARYEETRIAQLEMYAPLLSKRRDIASDAEIDMYIALLQSGDVGYELAMQQLSAYLSDDASPLMDKEGLIVGKLKAVAEALEEVQYGELSALLDNKFPDIKALPVELEINSKAFSIEEDRISESKQIEYLERTGLYQIKDGQPLGRYRSDGNIKELAFAEGADVKTIIHENAHLLEDMLSPKDYAELLDMVDPDFIVQTTTGKKILTKEGREYLATMYEQFVVNNIRSAGPREKNMMAKIKVAFSQVALEYLRGKYREKFGSQNKADPTVTDRVMFENFNPFDLLREDAKILAGDELTANQIKVAQQLEAPISRGIQGLLDTSSKSGKSFKKSLIDRTEVFLDEDPAVRQAEDKESKATAKRRVQSRDTLQPNDNLIFDLRPSQFPTWEMEGHLRPEKERAYRNRAEANLRNKGEQITPENIAQELQNMERTKLTATEIDQAFFDLKNEGKNVDILHLSLRLAAYTKGKTALRRTAYQPRTPITNRTIVRETDVAMYSNFAVVKLMRIFGVEDIRQLQDMFNNTEDLDIDKLERYEDFTQKNQIKAVIRDPKVKSSLISFVNEIEGTPGMFALSRDLRNRIKNGFKEDVKKIDIYLSEIAEIRNAIIDVSVPASSRRNKIVEAGAKSILFSFAHGISGLIDLIPGANLQPVFRKIESLTESFIDRFYEKTSPRLLALEGGFTDLDVSPRITELMEEYHREMRSLPSELLNLIQLLNEKHNQQKIREAQSILGIDNNSPSPEYQKLQPGMLQIGRLLRRFIHPPVDIMHLPKLLQVAKVLQQNKDGVKSVSDLELEVTDASSTLRSKAKELEESGVVDHFKHYDVLRKHLDDPDRHNLSQAEGDKIQDSLDEFNKIYKQTFASQKVLTVNQLAETNFLDKIDTFFAPEMHERELKAITDVRVLVSEVNNKMLSDEQVNQFNKNMDIIYDGVLRRESEVMRKGAVIYSSLSKRGDEFKELSLTSPSDKAKALQAYTLFYTGKINIGDIDVEILQQKLYKEKEPINGDKWTTQDLITLAQMHGVLAPEYTESVQRFIESRFDVKFENIEEDQKQIVHIANRIVTEPASGNFESLMQMLDANNDINLPTSTIKTDLGQMMLEMFVRLIAEEKLDALSRKIAETHIYGDLRQVAREKLIENGFNPITDGDAFLERVKTLLNNWMKNGDMNVAYQVGEKRTYRRRADTELERSASEVANQIINTYGLLPGTNDNIEVYTSPSGEKFLLPKTIIDHLNQIIDDVAPISAAKTKGLASFTEFKDRRSNARRLNEALNHGMAIKDDIVKMLKERNFSEEDAQVLADQYMLEINPEYPELKRMIDEKIKEQRKQQTLLTQGSEQLDQIDIKNTVDFIKELDKAGEKVYASLLRDTLNMDEPFVIMDDGEIINQAFDLISSRPEIKEAFITKSAISKRLEDEKNKRDLVNTELEQSNFVTQTLENSAMYFKYVLQILMNKVATKEKVLKTLFLDVFLLRPINLLTKQAVTTGFIVLNFAYYVNNFFGAFQQAFVEGGVEGIGDLLSATVRDPSVFMTTLSLLHKNTGRFDPFGLDPSQKRSTSVFTTKDGRMYTPETLANAAQKYGIGAAFITAELARSLAEDIRKRDPNHPSLKDLLTLNSVSEFNMEIAQSMDNIFRLSLFMNELNRGLSEAEAAKKVRDTFYDYSDLSEFERTYLREAFLFYAYARKNQIQFMRALRDNPSRVMNVLRMVRNSQQEALGEETDERLLNPFLQNRYFYYSEDDPTKIFRGIEEWYQFRDKTGNKIGYAPMIGVMDASIWFSLLRPLLDPQYGIIDMGEEISKYLAGQTAVSPRAFLELYSGEQIFNDQQLSNMKIPAKTVDLVNKLPIAGTSLFGTASNSGLIQLKLKMDLQYNQLYSDEPYYIPANPSEAKKLYAALVFLKAFPATSPIFGRGSKQNFLLAELFSRYALGYKMGEPITAPVGQDLMDKFLGSVSLPTMLMPSVEQQQIRAINKETKQMREQK